MVTRPAHQNDFMLQQLTSLGATTIQFPCIEITPLDITGAVSRLPFTLDEIDLFIFISANAVRLALEQIPQLSALMKGKICAAVGQPTAQALQQAECSNILFPSQAFDSEALLNLTEMNAVANKTVLIIKGTGGRPKLHDTLRSRNARVFELEVYQRSAPTSPDLSLLNHQIDAILMTSSESVENFLLLAPKNLQARLLKCQTIAGHARIAEKVSSLGFEKLPIIAGNPSDAEMLAALLEWAKRTEIPNE